MRGFVAPESVISKAYVSNRLLSEMRKDCLKDKQNFEKEINFLTSEMKF